MIDSTRIDEMIVATHHAVGYARDWLRYHVENINSTMRNTDGSIVMTAFSAYDFMDRLDEYVQASAKLKLLELIASPTFYDAMMRSAAEKPAP